MDWATTVGNPAAEAVLLALGDRGFDAVELYRKRGRVRRLEGRLGESVLTQTEERGWAVRASSRRGSLFVAGTGEPRPAGPWPEADGMPIRLPDASPVAPWRPPGDLEAPLIVENEARELLRALTVELERELPGAAILRAVVEDGASEDRILSTRGIDASSRRRLATLFLEAVAPDMQTSVTLYRAERGAGRFNPRALARRLVDRLLVLRAGPGPERDRGDFLLAPPVGVQLLAGLMPLFVGPGAAKRVNELRDRSGQLARETLTLIDNGRLPGGLLESPVDGEGVATRETTIVESGTFRQPLLAWWQSETVEGRSSGCARRASWREVPRAQPTHLFWKPSREISVAYLLGEVARGYYLLDTQGAGRFDLAEDRFALPVCGFVIRSGRATAPLGRSWLCGPISGFLHGVQKLARDLVFLPLGGMLGSPSMLVTGLELRSAPNVGGPL